MSNGFLNLINRDGINYWVTEDVSLLVPGANGDLLSVVNGKAAWITQSSILDTFVTAVSATAPLASSGGLSPNISIVPGAEGTFLKVVGGVATWAAASTIATFSRNSAVGPALIVTDTNPINSDNPIATFYSSTGNGATVKMGTSNSDNVRFKYDGGFAMEVVPYTGPAPYTAAQLFLNSTGSVNGPRAFECEEFHLYRGDGTNIRDRSIISTPNRGLLFAADGTPSSVISSFVFVNSDNTEQYLELNNSAGGFNLTARNPTNASSIQGAVTLKGSLTTSTLGGGNGNLSVAGTTTLSPLTASTALALNASKQIISVTNNGTGNNVLSSDPIFPATVTVSGTFKAPANFGEYYQNSNFPWPDNSPTVIGNWALDREGGYGNSMAIGGTGSLKNVSSSNLVITISFTGRRNSNGFGDTQFWIQANGRRYAQSDVLGLAHISITATVPLAPDGIVDIYGYQTSGSSNATNSNDCYISFAIVGTY